MKYGALKNGSPSAYMFALGFSESFEYGSKKVKFFMVHEHYHVKVLRASNEVTLELVYPQGKLTEARREYSRVCKQVKNGTLY